MGRRRDEGGRDGKACVGRRGEEDCDGESVLGRGCVGGEIGGEAGILGLSTRKEKGGGGWKWKVFRGKMINGVDN